MEGPAEDARAKAAQQAEVALRDLRAIASGSMAGDLPRSMAELARLLEEKLRLARPLTS